MCRIWYEHIYTYAYTYIFYIHIDNTRAGRAIAQDVYCCFLCVWYVRRKCVWGVCVCVHNIFCWLLTLIALCIVPCTPNNLSVAALFDVSIRGLATRSAIECSLQGKKEAVRKMNTVTRYIIDSLLLNPNCRSDPKIPLFNLHLAVLPKTADAAMRSSWGSCEIKCCTSCVSSQFCGPRTGLGHWATSRSSCNKSHRSLGPTWLSP